MNEISIKGVTIGSMTDIVATNILMIPLVIYVLAANDFSSLPQSEMQVALTDKIKNDNVVNIVSILLGSLGSILGGYISARIAKHDQILNGGLASILCVGGGLYAFISGSMEGEYLKHVLLLFTSPLLSATGGYLAFHRAQSHA